MPQIDYTMTKENYHCILQRHSVNSELNLCGEKKKSYYSTIMTLNMSKICKNYLKKALLNAPDFLLTVV